MEIGVLACLEALTLQGCFALLAEGTAAEGSALIVRTRPLSGDCPECGERVRTSGRSFSCPLCAGDAVDWKGGHELEITSITVTPSSEAASGT
jgi:hydrogenase nickel incorporation protein HypA/HybF